MTDNEQVLEEQANKKSKENKKQENQAARQAAEVSRKVAKKGAKQARKAARRFGALAVDTTKSMLGMGERRVQRHSNRTITGRFINDIVSIAETNHIAGMAVDLSKVYIEPRFLPLPPINEPQEKGDIEDEVFKIVPRTFDIPAIMSPYHLESYGIPDLARGHRKIAILGSNGSGRTTSLMLIALWVMREIHFREPDDPVKQAIAEAESELSEKERKQRESERKKEERYAMEELEASLRNEDDKKPKRSTRSHDDDEEELPQFGTLLPIYIHCADLNITMREFGAEVDPAEPVVRALQRRVGTLTARTIPKVVYQRLEQNKTLILMDGYDDLPDSERRRVEAWLEAFMEEYGNNFIVMTGPATGYANLMRLGFATMFMKPWNDQETQKYVERWRDAWPSITGTRRKPGDEPSIEAVKHAMNNNVGLSPAEMTIKVWATFTEGRALHYMDEWMEVFIQRHLPKNQPYDEALPLLRMAATLQTDLGFLTRQGIYVLLAEQIKAEKDDETSEASLTQAALNQMDIDGDGVADADEQADLYDEDDDDDDEEDEEMVRQRRLVNELVFSGMLVQFRGGRYRFRHRLIADYLASLNLSELPENDPATLYNLAQRPNWQEPLKMAVMHTNLDNVVRMKLMEHPDILRSNILGIGLWLAYTKEEKPAWRGEILRQLGNAFVHPKQYLAIRQRIAAVLVQSRDVAGALNIFDVGLGNENIDVRVLSCLGIGAFGKYAHKLVPKLIDISANPEEEDDVRVAAFLALESIKNDDALNHLITYLTEQIWEREQVILGQAITESLAQNVEHGMITLHEMSFSEDFQDDDYAFLRAAIYYGLRRVPRKWAQDDLRDLFLGEKNQYARMPAVECFKEKLEGMPPPDLQPHPTDIKWMQYWAEDVGRPLPRNERAYFVMASTMIEDADSMTRYYAALNLGEMGIIEAIKPLYGLLSDYDASVQDAAYEALAHLQLKLGEKIADPR